VPDSTIHRRALPFSSLRGRIGVTRVARLTGLDRAGVEVATAVRPLGHVLQVSNGKGERWAEAARGAVLEAAELWAAEHPPPGAGPLAWAEARDLLSGEPLLVPARAVWCPPAGQRPLGGPETRWTSNGMGAHPSWTRALLHALLEAVERDQLARALPRLWTRGAVRRRMLDRATLAEGAPRTARLAARIERGGFEVFLFDLRPSLGVDSGSRSGSGSGSGSKDVGLPVAGALLFDLRHSPVPVAAGYACSLSADQALRGALLEAAQSRLTDIHGAREDVEAMDPEAAARLRALCEGVRPRCRARHIPSLPARGPRQAVAAVLGRIRRAGFPHVAACRLTPSGHPVQVAKVLVPGFRISELL